MESIVRRPFRPLTHDDIFGSGLETVRDPIFLHGIEGPFQEGRQSDPVDWYFWDETWADHYGPFTSFEEAQDALAAYAKKDLV